MKNCGGRLYWAYKQVIELGVRMCVTYACVFLTKDDLLYLTQKALGFSRFLIPELPSKKASPLIFSGKSGLPRFYQKKQVKPDLILFISQGLNSVILSLSFEHYSG